MKPEHFEKTRAVKCSRFVWLVLEELEYGIHMTKKNEMNVRIFHSSKAMPRTHLPTPHQPTPPYRSNNPLFSDYQ